jgi:hypothetical protein
MQRRMMDAVAIFKTLKGTSNEIDNRGDLSAIGRADLLEKHLFANSGS